MDFGTLAIVLARLDAVDCLSVDCHCCLGLSCHVGLVPQSQYPFASLPPSFATARAVSVVDSPVARSPPFASAFPASS